MKFPLKYKLISIILIILIPMVIFSIYNFYKLLNYEKEQIKSTNIRIAASIANDLDELVDKSLGILHALAKHPAVIAKNTKKCDRIFSELLPLYPLNRAILATDMNGNNYGSGSNTKKARNLNFSDRVWFAKARKGKTVVGDMHMSKVLKAPSIMFSMPVLDNKGNQVGVISSSLNLPALSDNLVRKWQLPPNSSIDLIDSQGNIFLCTLHEEAPCQTVFNSDDFKKDLKSIKISEKTIGKENKKILYSFASLKNAGWKVVIGVPSEQAYKHASMMSFNYIGALLVVCLAALTVAMLLSKKITRNISSLSAGLKEIERGFLSYEIRLSGHDELNELAEAFNHMTKERRLAEQKVMDSESFLSSVLEGIGEGVIVINRDFKIILANNGYCDQVKTPCSEIIGKHCYQVSHHIDKPCYENGCDCTAKKCFETGEHHRAIHTHFNSKGNPKYIETNAYPLKDPDGNVISVIETLVDVTDMVLLESRLEEVKERYRKLYDDAPDMMHSVDKHGNIIICNQTEAYVLGYTAEELTKKSLMSIIAPESRKSCMQKFELLQKTGYFEAEISLLAKDGRLIPAFVKSKAIYDDNGNFLMTDSILRDISEKKRLEAQLFHSQKMEAVGQLAGGIAHDFNNILMGIMGFGNILQIKLGMDHPLRMYADQIILSAGRAANLTQNLLAFSRKQIINPKPTDLNEIVKTVEKLLLRIIGEDIELRCAFAEKNLTVAVDTGQIEQVLLNLATNARDAMPEGGLLTIKTGTKELDSTFIEVHGYGNTGMYAVLSVTDTGKGIGKEHLEKIFEPFFTTKETGKGTGLGLSIAYGIIKQHNGYITVSSEPEKGTSFSIYLPLIHTDFMKKESAETTTEISKGTETVLIAEDDTLVRELIKNTLKEFGYQVIEASDGEDAVDKFMRNKDRVSLFIADVIMPKKNGKDAYEEIRRIRPDIKVLYTSGYTPDIIHKRGVLEPGTTYLQKPVLTTELLKKIREVLDGK